MKICMVLTRLGSKPGGVESVVLELSKGLVNRSHEVDILCRNEFKDKPIEKINSKITVHRINCIRKTGFKTITSIPKILNFLLKEKYDIIHVHDWSPFISVFPVKFLKNKIITTLHNSTVGIKLSLNDTKFLNFYKFLESFPVKHSQYLTCVSPFLKKKIENFYKKENILVIPNGINTDKFRPTKFISEDFILFVGRMEQSKGVQYFCKVAKYLTERKTGIKFKAIGDGPLLGILKKKYSQYIDFLGEVSREELIRNYQHCRFLISLPLFEGFGLVWLEAMACGKPIIGTYTGIAPQLIRNSDFGILVKNPEDIKELSAAVLSLYTRVSRKESFIAKKIRKFVEKKFSWDKIIKKYEKLYKLCLEKRNY